MLLPTQKRAAEAIVNIFETSAVLGDYSMVTLIAGDSGHLTFGRSQTTLASGNLHKLVQRYCETPGARLAGRLQPYLAPLAAADLRLDDDLRLHNLLRASADDPLMRETQDLFFDDTYWQPAARAAERLGIRSALGTAVVYDSFVHGSWQRIKERTEAAVGRIEAVGEQRWIAAYVDARAAWLANHSRADLRATVYRMESFRRLIDQGYWGLELPLVVRGFEVSSATLNGVPPGCYDGPVPGTRPLALASPLARGLDVRLLQLGLSEAGASIKADGIFGQTTARLLRDYQQSRGLPVTGVADIGLVAQLAA